VDEQMAHATGEVVETPTAEQPYKAVIKHNGVVIGEHYFPSRIEAKTFIGEILQSLQVLAHRMAELKYSRTV
jgi:hypothetical protein